MRVAPDNSRQMVAFHSIQISSLLFTTSYVNETLGDILFDILKQKGRVNNG